MVETRLKIEGMSCSMCEAHINDAVRNALKVKKVSSSHKKGETVVLSETELDRNSLKDAIERTGYKVVSIESGEKKPGLFGR